MQHVNEILSGNVAGRGGRERAPTDAAQARVKPRYPALDRGNRVGEAGIAGVVEMRPQREPRRGHGSETRPHVGRARNSNRIGKREFIRTCARKRLFDDPGEPRDRYLSLKRAAERSTNDKLSAEARAARGVRDVRPCRNGFVNAGALVSAAECLARDDDEHHGVDTTCDGPIEPAAVEHEADALVPRGRRKRGNHRVRISHARNKSGIDETGNFDPPQPGNAEAANQFNLVMRGKRDGLVLQPVPGRNLDDRHTVAGRVHGTSVLGIAYDIGFRKPFPLTYPRHWIHFTRPTGARPRMTDALQPSRGPLADLRIIETGQLLAGPFCGQLLADFGAEVIKIEPPGSGDPLREWGREKPHGKSLWFPVVGRNKKSVTIDLRREEGQELARRLLADADILIENFRPGTMERWGLGWQQLSQLNPRLVMVRVTGYGQTGPYAKRAGFGAIGEAMGGLRYVVGAPDAPPSRAGISIGDSLAATFAAFGALMAIHARQHTGRGQVVDSAIYEAVLAMMESLITEYDQTGYIRERTGAILPNIAPSNVYPTKDGQFLLIAANQDTVFRRLAEAMGQPQLALDPRYATHTARGERQGELDAVIAAWTATLEAGPLETLMESSGVPAGRIYRAPDMLADPHFAAREAIVHLAHRHFGRLAMQNVAPRLSATPGAVRHAAPELGEHNDEILGGLLHMSAGDRAKLSAAKVI